MTPGTKLGPYEILAPLGEGGMGQVWKARDSRLDRMVAIKTLRDRFSERFEREAHAIAALNHPHICSLYDVGPDYLVMEHVEGKLLRGPLPLNEAITYAGQILDALDAAHRKGITHRDLKPANILVTKAGVKLLDFGLAKQTATGPDDETATRAATGEGISGTLQYMSPEQVEGKEADPRSDIFAFGLVLYEMITGKRAFEGSTQASLIASILKDQPRTMSAVQPLAPKALDRVLETCLEKDPDKRWQSAREVKHALEWISLETPPQAAAPKRWIWPTAVAAIVVLIGILTVAVWAPWRVPPPEPAAIRFQVPLPENASFNNYMAVSPDGRKLAFNTAGSQGGIWIRDLDSLQLRLLPGTENGVRMFWSPDSRFIGFSVARQLKKIDVSGGRPQTLAEIEATVGSGAWNPEGVIIFGSVGGPLYRTSSAGGVPTAITVLDSARGEGLQTMPSFLPDGRHFIYHRGPPYSGAFLGSLDGSPEEQGTKQLLSAEFAAVYQFSASSGTGWLFFLRESTLMAQPFDVDRFELTGEPTPVAEHIGNGTSHGFFSVAASGVLAYRTGTGVDRQLTWFDRNGKVLGTAGEPAPYPRLTLSPDFGRVAVVRSIAGLTRGDLWVLDLARGVSTPLTFDSSVIATPASNPGSSPVWSPDGKQIAFVSNRGAGSGDVYEKASSGAGNERVLINSLQSDVPTSWSRDGRFLLYDVGAPRRDMWVLPLEAKGSEPSKPIAITDTEFNETQGSFSPDGRWIAYTSDESGRPEIYVQPFTPPGSASLTETGKWLVSKDGGIDAKWRSDGKELFFRGPTGTPMTVDVRSDPTFQVGTTPKPLFTLPASVGAWDVTGDGNRLLVAMPLQQTVQEPITVISNWEASLKR